MGPYDSATPVPTYCASAENGSSYNAAITESRAGFSYKLSNATCPKGV